MNYYQKSISEIFKEFETSKEGLSNSEALLRLRKFGFNRLKTAKTVPLVRKFLNQFTDLLVLILITAGIIAIFAGEPRDSLIIFSIVFINALISFFQEYKAERILAAFKKHLPSFSKVIRNGEIKKVLTMEVVPGDILFLEAGDAIAADARLIEAFNLKTNDFSLTGESKSQEKKAHEIKKETNLTDIDNMVFMGTTVAEGKGKAVVVNTAMNTEFGKIAKTSQEVKEEPTPLQKEIAHTGKTTLVIAISVSIFCLILFHFLGKETHESLLFAIAAGVAVVPEGLPAAISIALSLGARRMLKKKALVKKLLHVESLGSVNIICTDKTGTLTTGEMSVVEVKMFRKEKKLDDLFFNALALCNNASIVEKPIGDPLEVALLKYFEKEKGNIEKLRKENKQIFEIPFSSKRKMMTVVYERNKEIIAYTKGACLESLEICNLPKASKEKIIKENDKMAKRGLRVIAIAYKKLPNKNFNKKELEKDLNFLGLIGIEDPPRKGVKEAIEMCHKAHIKVIMITGDYGLTALAIAKQIGLASDKTQIITGVDLHNMDDEKLKKVLKKEVIFARIDPSQKLRIVQNLQEMGDTVAVTGDGVNDVPALVKADIGISMGKIGTDVAKEAADMVLLDDHFATIVNAIQEGRRIFDNAKNFVYYIFSSNSGELFAPLLGIILGLPLPLIAVQILAIDLGTDVFPSLALGVEKPEPNLMSGPPRSKNERIMSIQMLTKLLRVGLVMSALALIVYLITLYKGGWKWGGMLSANNQLYWKATASVYATLVLCQVANAFSCRSEKLSIFKVGIFSNIWLIWAEIISLLMLWAVIGFSPLQNIFRTSLPPYYSWIFIIASFFIFLLIEEWVKKIKVNRQLTANSQQ